MRDELRTIFDAIGKCSLPATFDELLSLIWDADAERFHVQETYILDYKDRVPDNFSDEFGAGIVRLALAFHNSFGGIIIFGVNDRAMDIKGVSRPFDVESFNRVLTDFAGISTECVAKLYRCPTTQSLDICVVLVPARGLVKPAQLTRDLGKHKLGTIWIRDRHQVTKAEIRHLPILFSDRKNLPFEGTSEYTYPIHRSFPPSPATVKEFVNRGNILTTLWSWFILGDNPRLYLHGAGGSGKSTLAFEFARLLAEHGDGIKFKGGDRLDYVIYLSAKETELNTLSGEEQIFTLRQFSSFNEQISQIVYHSGLLKDVEIGTPGFEILEHFLSELFDNFSGLIVLDDIDALSRRGADTGEETLFIKTVQAKKRTRILYTLRFPPAHALGSALPVPGLERDNEFSEFIEVCCKQFEVPSPKNNAINKLFDQTSGLPLLIETIIGLRKYCGTYEEAIHQFSEQGGDEARRYLYQREYDRLSTAGKSRQVLAGLMLLQEPVSFSTITSLFQFSGDLVREALSECGSIFLSTFNDEKGETLYQLTPSATSFVRRVSENLFYFTQLQATVRHFKAEGSRHSPQERAMLVSMNSLIRLGKFDEIIAIGESLSASDPIFVNPDIRSLLGQAYAEAGSDYREKARQCFKHSEGLGYRDVFMMRRWFHLEVNSGYGLSEAERICRAMIDDQKSPPRVRSEFWSKLGSCHSRRATSLLSVAREKGIEHLKESIVCYMEGTWIASSIKDFDSSENIIWLERPVHRLIMEMGADIDIYFDVLERLLAKKHDADIRGMQLLIDFLARSPVPANDRLRTKLKGLCARVISKITRQFKNLENCPGFEYAVTSLRQVSEAI